MSNEKAISNIPSARKEWAGHLCAGKNGYKNKFELDDFVRYLKHPAIRVGKTRVYLSPETFQRIKKKLEHIAHIWQFSSFTVCIDHCSDCKHESFHKDLLSSRVFLKTPKFTLHIESNRLNFKLCLSKYSHLYACSQFKMANLWMDVEKVADFVLSTSAHPQNSFLIQFKMDLFQDWKNEKNSDAVVVCCNNTPNLTLDIDWKELTFKLWLSEYSHLYDSSQLKMALLWMDVEKVADFVISTSAHCLDSFSIQFQMDLFQEWKNEKNSDAVVAYYNSEKHMLPFFVIHETLSFFNRDGLERISICNRQFHRIVTKYFATKPYRYLTYLDIHCNTNTPIAEPLESDLTERVISHIRSACEGMSRWDGRIFHNCQCVIDLDEFLPYLKHPAVYVAKTRVFLCCETFQSVKQSLERAAPIWQHSPLLVSVYRCSNCNHESFYKDLLSSEVLLKTPKLTLDIDWKELTFKLSLSKYSHLYDCNQLKMELSYMSVKEAVDFVHSIPAHRQDSFSIQFKSFSLRKNKKDIVVARCIDEVYYSDTFQTMSNLQ
ncbi:hypothetical protein Ddc_14558 [Ditylenchus destructor]|nr:hypothetical protein Ddc_14558 [Ditylenchus destructor]